MLNDYLNKIYEGFSEFDYNGELEQTKECLYEIILLSIQKINFLKTEHCKNEQLFTDQENEEVRKKFDNIYNIVDSFEMKYGKCKKEKEMSQEMISATSDFLLMYWNFLSFI